MTIKIGGVSKMQFEDFKQIVERTKKEKPVWFELGSDSCINDNEIRQIENYFGSELPIEYKQFLKNYGGGYFAFLLVFSGDEKSNWNVIKQNKELNLLNKYNFLAVSDNESGDFYGFRVNNNKCETKLSVFLHDELKVKETQYEDFYQYVLKLGLKA